jgi:formylmethanofuran dehydrogenase subunit B
VVIGLPQLQLKQEPEVFIPVATPGVDHTGQLIRCDNVVSLPLRQVRTSPLPTVAGALNAIQHAL